MTMIHPDFISLADLCPAISIQANYSTSHNFTGEVVLGYRAQKAYLIKAVAEALCKVQESAEAKGLTLKIFDGYRPVKAVLYFLEWSQRPEDNLSIKEEFYPTYSREELFLKGFIAKQSSHSKGCAVDLTLVDLKTGKDLDMGSHFDYFHDRSHMDSPKITAQQKKNRMLLKELMETKGFKNYSNEWWHYSYKSELYHQFHNFDVE